jgi:hypothetical protein
MLTVESTEKMAALRRSGDHKAKRAAQQPSEPAGLPRCAASVSFSA